MTSITFDTLAYTKKLITAGVSPAQAEIQAETLAEIIDEKLVTKQELISFEERLIKKLEYTLSIRLGSMLIITVFLLSILFRILYNKSVAA